MSAVRNPAVWLISLPIRFYRRYLSPRKSPCCRFTPTCSAYALEALSEWGALRGTALAVWRILRCNPFGRGGYDPVPPNKRRRARLARRAQKRAQKQADRADRENRTDRADQEDRADKPSQSGGEDREDRRG